MIGAHVGPSGDPDWKAEYTGLETLIGRPLAIDSDYAYWSTFPDTPRLAWDVQTSHLPMQSWRVEFSQDLPVKCATAAQIDSGQYDAQLMRQARAVKAVGSTVLVRFNFEMTDSQENTCFTGFPVRDNLPLAAQEFITAWRHVVDRFRSAGASNVQWVWAPGRTAYKYGRAALFYPGSTYVDWIAIDMYNKSLKPIAFGSSPGVSQFYAWASGQGKPLMISENGAYDDPTQSPSPQSEWISTARTFMKARPAIKAYVYWDGTPPTPPPPPTYQLQGQGLEAFKAMASDPYFGGR